MVSVRRRSKHICGGTIVTEKHVVTAAHCFTDKEITRLLTVCIINRDFTATQKPKLVFTIIKVIVHPKFLQSHPINHDIALLVLKDHIVFGAKIQPACIPNPDEFYPPGSLCVALGWGRTKERGPVATSLQQVTLPIVEHQDCMRVMATLDRNVSFKTAVCAGFPEGGKDACQGDSGGPFLCPRIHGRWVLVGVTSWGMGCARSWTNNKKLPLERRGSPGIFTDIKKMLVWLNTNLNQENSKLNIALASCGATDQLLNGTAGTLKFPKPPHKYYLNNEKCTWTIYVPEGKHMLLTFDHFDLEFDYSCDMDYLAVYFENGSFIGKFCGGDRPRPLLIKKNTVNLKFISDFRAHGTGFVLSYEAVGPEDYAGSECGSVAVVTGEGEIQTMNHPKEYSSSADCKWIVHAPASFIIKVTFLAFELEPSRGCVYDYLVLYNGLDGIDMAGKFCGLDIPKPVMSKSNIMQIIFCSDSRGNHIGFRAKISFHDNQSFQKKPADIERYNPPKRHGNKVVDADTGCVATPLQPMFINQSITVAEEAYPNSWPWHVSIRYGIKHFCNGVIVAKTFVLTAANCVARKRKFLYRLLVVAGVHDLERSEDTQKRSIKNIMVHPRFVSYNIKYDVALLQLSKPLQFNDYVQPVCFPHSYSMVGPSSICVVSGWDLNGEGKTARKLEQLEVPLETDSVCQSYYGRVTQSMFCAGTTQGQTKRHCHSQPGSPLVCPSRDLTVFFIYGIASMPLGCSGKAKPALYIRIAFFTKWIQNIINPESTDKVHHRDDPAEDDPGVHTEDQPDQISNSQEQPSAFSNDSISQSMYIECKGVVSLQSPGEVKLVADSQDSPEGFSCQLNVEAPDYYFIKLNIKEMNTSDGHNSQVMIYEGLSNDKTLIAQLTVDNVPGTISSTSSALTIEANSSAANARLQLCLSFSFYSNT